MPVWPPCSGPRPDGCEREPAARLAWPVLRRTRQRRLHADLPVGRFRSRAIPSSVLSHRPCILMLPSGGAMNVRVRGS